MRVCAVLGLSLLLGGCGPTSVAGDAGSGDDDSAASDGAPPGSADAADIDFIDASQVALADAGLCDQAVPITIEFLPTPPDILLVVDKSGSMSQFLDILNPFVSKWQVMHDALDDVVTAKQDKVHFGLMLYPADNNCAGGTVLTGVAPMNAGPITTALDATAPDGNTPTHTSLAAARAYYASIPVNPHGRYVLLATDGLPNCAPAPDDAGDAASLAEVTALESDGIKTYVIGFGSVFAANPFFLQSLAQAGGTGNYYQADSAAALATALDTITGTVIPPSCTIDLATTPADPSLLGVTFDGVDVPRSPSHAQGWDYDPATNTITFYGAECAALQSGSVTSVGVDYGCGGPVVE